MYKTTTIVLNKNIDKQLFHYMDENASKVKLLKNAVIFRCRQLLFARWKDFKDLDSHQIEVLKEFFQTEDKFTPINDSYYLPTYEHFDYMFKITKNPDYYSGLPSHVRQYTIKEALESFKAYFAAIKDYNNNKNKYTGKPKLPKYIKSDKISFTTSNQESVFKQKKNTMYLKLPKTKKLLRLGKYNPYQKLIEVVIKPYYDTYKICIVSEFQITDLQLNSNNIIGIDLGIDNFLAVSNNCGLTPFVINGKIMKSVNQNYNKTVANLRSRLPQNQYSSKRLTSLYKFRTNYFTDKIHKISSYVIQYCIDNNIGTIVVGKNKQWKTMSNMNKTNNQNFCSIPHSVFIQKLKEKAETVGIQVIETEEAYTSKASFLDGDIIPNYQLGQKFSFSGKRVQRGLYKSKNNILINADINGASNIIKKVVPTAFDNITDFNYLYKTTIRITI